MSARTAGLRAPAVGWGYGDSATLYEAGAEQVCATAAELGAALNECLLQAREALAGDNGAPACDDVIAGARGDPERDRAG